MDFTRRQVVRNSAVSLGFLGLRSLLGGLSAPTLAMAKGYGELVPDPERVIDLPRGFEYKILSRTGAPMDDGLVVPASHDGMAAFSGPGGKTILVRNHEMTVGPARLGAFGDKNEMLGKVDAASIYDRGGGKSPSLGGTTTLVYDTKTKTLERHFLSLAGTLRNCAGGPTTWNSWITCEETIQKAEGNYEKDHGYCFEVPATAEPALAPPIPLKDMGRFNHEAIAMHAASGIVYLTEDRGDGLLYRFLPNHPGKLAEGGRLQALVARDRKSLDTRNWDSDLLRPGQKLAVQWITMEEVQSPKDDLRARGYELGAARFARGEGMWSDRNSIYFACTNGGRAKKGQIFKYTASPGEGTKDEQRKPGMLELFIEPNNADLLENADNLTVAPWGDLVICEDGKGEQYLVGVTPKGELYKLGRNSLNQSEFAGACFSPDGSTLFVNIQTPGLTLAITGPWRRRG